MVEKTTLVVQSKTRIGLPRYLMPSPGCILWAAAQAAVMVELRGPELKKDTSEQRIVALQWTNWNKEEGDVLLLILFFLPGV